MFSRVNILTVFPLAMIIFVSSLFASDTFAPQFNPQLEIKSAAGAINIDGEINDPGWADAAVAVNFTERQPGDQIKPPVETFAYITYDDEKFYVACICYDEPEEIRATICDRDKLVGNDVIVLQIDTYAEAAWAYNLYVNPLGVQTDAMWKPAGADFGYNIIYESAGKITDSGYQVEIAIPFSSLHFPSRDIQTWRFDVLRIRPHESWSEYCWSAYDRNNPCEPCQWGTITGMENIKPARGIEILPSFVGYQSGEGSGNLTPEDPYHFDNFDPEGELSLNAKYKPLSNISLELTINPDFSQIEPDAAQIDVNTTSALFYPERRPFYQEASELFYTWRGVYYSRMINDPYAAFKASGKVGKSSFGYLFAYDEHSPYMLAFEEASINPVGGESYSNVARLRHTFGQDTFAGLLLTDRRIKGGGSGTVINFDSQIRYHENWRTQIQMMGSYIVEPDDVSLNEQIDNYISWGWIDSTFERGKHTTLFDGESYYGYYILVNLEERSRHFDFDMSYLGISPTYRSDLGFLRINDWQWVCFMGQYKLYYDNIWLEKLSPYLNTGVTWNFDGRKKTEDIEAGIRAKLKGQLDLDISYLAESEVFRNTEYEDIWNLSFAGSKSFGEKLYISSSIDYGQQISRKYQTLGKQTSIDLYAYIRPNDHFQIEPNYNYIKLVDADDNSTFDEGYILWTSMYYHFNRRLNIRLIAQYNDIYETLNFDPLFTYRINPFTVFYLGTTYEYRNLESTENGFPEKNMYLNRRQFFAKLQYLFQF